MSQEQSPGLSPGDGSEFEHPPPVSKDAIREELNRVLASHEFRSSKRSQEFLKFVVEHTLNGSADILKERTIGIEVFGRSTSYDPSDDATVRVKAGEVRKRLGLYYAGQGASDLVRIEMPGGTYVPEFRGTQRPEARPIPPTGGTLPVVAEPAGEPARAWSSRSIGFAALLLALVLAGVAAFFIYRRAHVPETMLDQFWAPVFKANAPLSLCAAYVPVYAPSREATPQQPLRAEDFILLNDQFVGGGDLVAVSRLAAMLTRMDRAYLLRIGGDVSFHDLSNAPAILVGYSYTRWKEISSQLRFFIDMSRQPAAITDNGAPTEWSLPHLPADRRTTEDYAIVSRVFHPDTHAMLVELAGVTQYGTEAAADLVSSSDLLAEALRGAPADWQTKNLQLVLHVKVISGAPTSPKVVASHFW
jgi:hypothetical protein